MTHLSHHGPGSEGKSMKCVYACLPSLPRWLPYQRVLCNLIRSEMCTRINRFTAACEDSAPTVLKISAIQSFHDINSFANVRLDYLTNSNNYVSICSSLAASPDPGFTIEFGRKNITDAIEGETSYFMDSPVALKIKPTDRFTAWVC